MAGSRGTVRHLCRDKNGRPVKRPRNKDSSYAKHADNCAPKMRNRGWAFGIRLRSGPGGYLRRGGFKSEQAANEALAEVIKQYDLGIDPTVKPPTVSEWLDDWLALRRYTKRKQPIRPQSHALYRQRIDKYIRPALGHLRLDTVRLVDVERLFDGIRAANEHAERPVGLATQNALMKDLRSVFDLAVKHGKLVRNPLGDFGVEPYEPPEKQVWTPDQANAVLDAAQEHAPELAAAFALVIFHGLRRNEVLGLRWQDVDLKNNRLHVRQQLGGGPPKSKKGRRDMPLIGDTSAILRAHHKRQLEQRLRAEGAWEDNDLVLVRPNGSPLTPKQLARAWDVVSRKAGVPYISLHGGRHTAATMMLIAGVPLKIVSDWMGHASTRITSDLYQHVLVEHETAAAELIGSLRTRRSDTGS